MKQHYILLLLVIIFLSKSIAAKAQVNKQDSLALVDLYNSTNGPQWYHHDNWLTGSVTSWWGILVNNHRVVSVSLGYNNLTGSIPSSLSDLSNLKTLFLNSNRLSGNIPPALGNLSRLTELFLNGNQLSGDIPPELGNISTLTYLYLAYNQLSGYIPPELSDLSNLSDLSLSNNNLNGSIPPELGELSNLNYLYLLNNRLSGNIPPELGNLSNLYYLDLQNNQLSGNIPPKLGKLSNLGELRLNNNQLSGNIPPEVGNLSNLRALALHNNQLTGIIPSELGNLSNLEVLILNNNQLSGNIPSELGKLLYIRSIQLSHNRLTGNIPSAIANLIYPFLLDFSHNKFTFDGMELIAQTFPAVAVYDWQMPVPLYVNGNTLSVSAGGALSNNTYVWYKRDKPGNVTIKGDSVFHPTESGTYFVKVRNKIAKDLKLVSRAIKYIAPSPDAVALNKPLEILNENFSVYPNPAKNTLHVITNDNTSFSLTSAEGKIILTKNINKAGTIDLSRIAAGIYYLRNDNTNDVRRISIIK